ncbi:MAG: hypothetical protein R3B47_15355 [Bacteroidia bacterium]
MEKADIRLLSFNPSTIVSKNVNKAAEKPATIAVIGAGQLNVFR